MKTLIRLLALTMVLAGTVVVAQTVSSSPSQAATKYLHMWADDHYKSRTLGRASYDSTFKNDWFCNRLDDDRGWYHSDERCPTFAQRMNFNDTISSIRNDTAYWWKMYEDTGYGGYVLCVRPYGYDNNIGNNTPVEDDISSVKRMNYDPDKNDQPGGCDQVIG